MYYVLSFCMLTYQRPLMPMKHRHRHWQVDTDNNLKKCYNSM
jgi:hypothetical protein